MFGIATNASVRQWTLAAAGLDLVIATVVATAPKPSCKCPATPPATNQLIAQELTLAHANISPRTSYLALLRARSLDTAGEYATVIGQMLADHAPRAAVEFVTLEDYDNAASAMLVAAAAE